ncbi:MAG: hypothetical protein K2W96_16720, partial [Gemmataceae bacterium]|nr:hypothetical protein [Gemmataceae bacterium]
MIFWLGIALLLAGPLVAALVLLYYFWHIRVAYMAEVLRIFKEKPLFIIPRGQPVENAERVEVKAADGRRLNGCYLKCEGKRRGVILFGLEFGSNCGSARHYCEHLLAAGYDVFALEPRAQADSETQPGYEPMQWVTEYEVADARAAIAWLKGRPDAEPLGIGFFGISKGAGAGLIAAADDPYVLCFATDGMFGTRTTATPYMRHWFRIYNKEFPREWIEEWVYRVILRYVLWRVGRERRCRFPSLERAMPKLAPRPLLMIHGEGDSLIKPDMARALHALAREPKELWIVPGAKHNQGLAVAGEEYRQRVLDFFDKNLGGPQRVPAPALAHGS